jgi:hypothetical protein
MKRFSAYAIAALAAGAVLTGTAAPAYADEEGYLNTLSSAGVSVTSQSVPILRFTGAAMCNEMQSGGRAPEDVAARCYYPNATHQNLLDVANAARSELCPA